MSSELGLVIKAFNLSYSKADKARSQVKHQP